MRQTKQKKSLKIDRLSKKNSSLIILFMDNFNPRNVCIKNVITIYLMLNVLNEKSCECCKQDKNLKLRKTSGQNNQKNNFSVRHDLILNFMSAVKMS